MVNETKEISNRIRQFIMDRFPIARQRSLLDDDALLGSNIVDSLGVMDLVIFVEAEFGINVGDEDLLPDNFQTITCMADFVRTKLSDRQTISLVRK